MRAGIFYLLSYLILLVYGGEVCPFIDTLSILGWGAELLATMVIMFAVRWVIMKRLVEAVPLGRRVARQFTLELLVFVAGGLILSVVNIVLHEFPPESGLKLSIGFWFLGLFTALDMALERERNQVSEPLPAGDDLPGTFFPLTRKFTLVASVVMVLTAIVFSLVIIKDLEWLTRLEPEEVKQGVLPILAEVGFIVLVILGFLLNLIMSFSRNLKLFFGNQNNTMGEVARGRLDVRASVSTADEFGIMARYTNSMIDGLRRLNTELKLTRDVTILSLASLAETRDEDTGAHILRTQRYVLVLCNHLKTLPEYAEDLTEETVDLLYKSSPLHDIGKVGIPDAVLLKPGRLTEEEFVIMKSHATLGKNSLARAEKSLGETSFLRHAKEIAWTHHEKWDGSGYPRGLKGEDIPLSGRLMALADVYDALISRRVYKEPFSHEKSKGIILEGRGTHFDPRLIDAFLAVEEDFLRIKAKYGDQEEETLAEPVSA